MTITPQLGIVIVGYNSRLDLPNCFKSIQATDYPSKEIIFVDNKSSDDSIEYLKKNFPKTVLVKNDQNYGFAQANNIGIKRAISNGAKYILVLNPDTILAKDCLNELVNRADDQTILQPLILLLKQKKTNLINTTGSYLNYLGFSYCNDYHQESNQIKAKEVASASGAGMLVPTSIFNQIGFFDQDYFMYLEDLDLSWRARLAGFQIRLVPEAVLWHHYSFSRNPQKMFLSEKNRLLFILKNFQTRTLFLILPMLTINELLILILAIFQGWFGAKIKSYWVILKQLKSIGAKRNKLTSIRQLTDRELKSFIGPKLDFSEVKLPILFVYQAIVSLYWQLINRLI